MGKTIRKTIQITTRKRNNSVKINEEFYSYDKNNAQFEFIMDYDIPADKVISLFHFENTNRYYETVCQFKGNLITIEFDTSLIVEDELVTGYLYFDKLEKSTDVYRFNFGVCLSEIDKTRELPVEEKVSRRIVPVADIVTKQELEELMDKIQKNGGTYDDTEIRELLSGKADSIDVVTKQELETKGYLTEHQSLEEYAKKTELYNDSALVNRVVALENKTDNDTVYNDTEVKERLTNLENKPPVDLSHLATKEELNEVRNSQPVLDTSNLVTKNELEAKGYLTAHQSLDEYAKKSDIPQGLEDRVSLLETKSIANGAYNDKPLLEKIREVEEQFNRASNLYLTSHQSLEHLVTKAELEGKGYLTSHQDISNLATNSKVEAVEQRVQVLENKPDVDLSHVVTKQELEDKHYIQDVSNLATTEKVTAVENRVQALENKSVVTHEELENKHYLVEHQSLDGLVTKEELAGKHYLTNHQPLDSYVTKAELEQAGYLKEHQSLSDYATKQELEDAKASIPQAYNDTEIRDKLTTLATKQELQTNDEEVKRRLTTLEGKTDNFITGVSVNKEGSNVTLTYNYVDGQTKNVSFTDSDTVNVAYDDSGVQARLTNLENRPQVDVTTLVSKAELPNLIQHQSLENYALKSELYNDSALTQRISNLENSTVTKQELQSKNYLTEHQSLDGYALKSELYNDNEIKQRLENLETQSATFDGKHYVTKYDFGTWQSATSKSEFVMNAQIRELQDKTKYEIHGTGMPNGKVTAPVGTTYVDTAATNGALKWIKQNGDGNTGWRVIHGDTGWRTLPLINKRGNAKLQIRRINDQVIVKFDGLQYGWFGVDDISKQTNNLVNKTINGKQYTWIKLNIGKGNQVLLGGFRSASSILNGLYGDLGDLLGSVYVGGINDQNAIQLRYAMPKEEITNTILSQIRISPVTFITDDEWPTTLP